MDCLSFSQSLIVETFKEMELIGDGIYLDTHIVGVRVPMINIKATK